MQSLFDFDTAFDRKLDKLENGITPQKIKIRTKIKFEDKMKREKVGELIDTLPEPGESLHIVSNGSFDYFTVIPHIIEMCGENVEDFYFSTWTLSVTNVASMLDMFDRGILKNLNALTGDYMKTREANVYHSLLAGIKSRGQRIANNKNHSKVTLMKCGENFFVVEGSANFTANPRIEQFVLTNHEGLFHFHKKWMEEIISRYAQ